MCLLVLAWKTAPSLPLLLAGNRDEFHARPTAPLAWWPDERMIAGRDLIGGGTWLGATRGGRFAVVTNLPRVESPPAPRSRGRLVTDYLTGSTAPLEHLRTVAAERARYAGFSIIVGDADEAAYYANADAAPRALEAGLHGLENDVLDRPSPRLARALAAVGSLLATAPEDDASLLGLWGEKSTAPGDDAPFRLGPRYGTRSTTILRRAAHAWSITEVAYAADGSAAEPRSFRWSSDP